VHYKIVSSPLTTILLVLIQSKSQFLSLYVCLFVHLVKIPYFTRGRNWSCLCPSVIAVGDSLVFLLPQNLIFKWLETIFLSCKCLVYKLNERKLAQNEYLFLTSLDSLLDDLDFSQKPLYSRKKDIQEIKIFETVIGLLLEFSIKFKQ